MFEVIWTILGLWYYNVDGAGVGTGCLVRLIGSQLNTKARVLHNRDGWITTTAALFFLKKYGEEVGRTILSYSLTGRWYSPSSIFFPPIITYIRIS